MIVLRQPAHRFRLPLHLCRHPCVYTYTRLSTLAITMHKLLKTVAQLAWENSRGLIIHMGASRSSPFCFHFSLCSPATGQFEIWRLASSYYRSVWLLQRHLGHQDVAYCDIISHKLSHTCWISSEASQNPSQEGGYRGQSVPEGAKTQTSIEGPSI